MLYTAEKQPAVFLPNDVRATVEQQLPGNLSLADWDLMLEIVDAVKQAIPDASNRPPLNADLEPTGGVEPFGP